MAGRNGIRWPWRYRAETKSRSYSYSTSSSGTVSTAYTSRGYTSRGYTSSGSVCLVAPMYSDWELDVQNAKRKEKQMKYVKSLVHEFFGASDATPAPIPQSKSNNFQGNMFFGEPSTNHSINIGDMNVLERWLTELGVAWVSHLSDGASAGRELDHAFVVRSWVQALVEIVETIGFTTSLFPDSGMVVVSEEEEQAAPDQLQFAHFFRETMLKMLVFVDWIVSEEEDIVYNGVGASSYEKLSPLLGVLGALSKASPQIQLSSYSAPSAQVQRIHGDMVNLFSAKEAKVGEAVWSKMEEIRSRIMEPPMEDHEDLLGAETPHGSSGIHKTTQTVASYIRFLRANYSAAAPLVFKAANLGKYVPRSQDVPPLDSMIIEMASCLEQKLVTRSRAFSDESLRLLFLLNNSHFILQQEVEPIWSAVQFNVTALDSKFLSFTEAHTEAVTRKIEGYMESYLQVSWTPVLSCLFNPKSLVFRINYSPLHKFEHDFRKTYNSQKLWKVPDPKLRKRLRKAIAEKIIPAYTNYIEDNKVTTPKLSPQELEEMVQEIFEG